MPWGDDKAMAPTPIAEEDLAFIRAIEASHRKAAEDVKKQPEIIEVKGAPESEAETLEIVRAEPPNDPSAWR